MITTIIILSLVILWLIKQMIFWKKGSIQLYDKLLEYSEWGDRQYDKYIELYNKPPEISNN